MAPEPPFMNEHQQMQHMMAATPPGSPPKKESKKNPLNLTDEQMQAVIAGIAAAVVFSPTVQQKLSVTVPQIEMGSVTSLLLSGTIVAAVFYFSKNMVNP